jgi:hypothetical protein
MVSDEAITAMVRVPESLSALRRNVLSTPPEKASTTDGISFNRTRSLWYLSFISIEDSDRGYPEFIALN